MKGCLTLVVGVIVLAIIIGAASTSSSNSSRPATTTSGAESSSTEEHPATPSNAAPSLDRGPAVDDAAHICGDGTTSNSHTSCVFAEKVRDSFAGIYIGSKTPPATISAYSPVTNHEYTLGCSLLEHRTVVECIEGDAAIVFPLISPEVAGAEAGADKAALESNEAKQGTPPTEESSSEGEDEVGSSSHAGDTKFCEEHTCEGEFTTEPGTIVECADEDYSHAGGISGACSDHGGESDKE